MAITNIGNDIYVDQYDCGVDVQFKLTNEDGTAFDLTDYVAEFIVKAKKNDTQVIVQENVECSDNVITVPITSEISSNPVGAYHYAIRLIKDEFVNTIIQAKFNIVNNTFESGV